MGVNLYKVIYMHALIIAYTLYYIVMLVIYSYYIVMTSQLLEKSSLWNDVVKILLYIDDELEMFKADLTEAYDEDIQVSKYLF